MPFLNAWLIVFVLICMTTDLHKGIIPNAVIAAGMLGALMMRFLSEGIFVLMSALAAAGVVVILLYPFWYLTGGKGIGAGDIKMLATVSVFFSAEVMLMVSWMAFSSAAVIGLIKLRYEARIPTSYQKSNSGGVHMAIYIALGALLHIGGLY